MEINEKINEIREDIATSEAALEKANGLLNSKLGHMLANFCGNPNRTKADLDAIKKEMDDSGNPYGVSIQIESERKGGEALVGGHLLRGIQVYLLVVPVLQDG